MVKYNVEGEKNLPLELDKVIIKSSINAKSNQSENLWDLNLEQDNDIYIYFKKNDKVDQKIESIKIANMKIEKAKEILNQYNQCHVASLFDKIDKAKQEELAKQVLNIDFHKIVELYDNTKKEIEIKRCLCTLISAPMLL